MMLPEIVMVFVICIMVVPVIILYKDYRTFESTPNLRNLQIITGLYITLVCLTIFYIYYINLK